MGTSRSPHGVRIGIDSAAVFVASDWGRTITGTQVNITCGGVLS